MLSGDQNKPAGKSGQRKKNTQQQGKKSGSQRRTSAQPQELQQDQLKDIPEVVSAPVVSTMEEALTGTSLGHGSPADSVPTVEVVSEQADPVRPTEAAPVQSTVATLVPSAEPAPVSYQTIANAYCNYTLESLDRTRSFFEKLAAVRSPDKALELQAEFAKQACDGFVTEAEKIRELHSELARQRVKRWEDFVARMISPSLERQ
jgi:hypothetical protein